MTPSHLSMSHDIAKLIRERIGSELDGECHLSEAEAINAADTIERLRAALKGYEALEASIIEDADWSHDTPRLTQEQFDELLRLQDMRNAALKGDRDD